MYILNVNAWVYICSSSLMQTVTITNLPGNLSGESFQCVFGGFGSGELSTVSGDMFFCSVPNIPSFVGEGGYGSMCAECMSLNISCLYWVKPYSEQILHHL